MEVAKVSVRGCGTCRDRKIACDRGVPTCQQCARSKRVCKGYGLQLSWPKPDDRRRALVVKQKGWRKAMDGGRAYSTGIRLVHTYSRDVELHHHLHASLPIRPTLRLPLPFYQTPLEARNLDLFEYFQLSASQSLAIFGHDPTHLGGILMRIALTGDTSSAAAVRSALLALSSLHRYGVQEQAFKFKLHSLRALSTTSMSDLRGLEAIQHIAAGMLLCSFEVHQSSCTSSQWTWYINGVKDVLRATCPKKYRRNEEVITLLNWVYYHDVMARFALRHWSGASANLPSNPSNTWPEGVMQVLPNKSNARLEDCVERRGMANLKTIGLLSDVCDAASTMPHLATMDGEELQHFKGFLTLLDWRIRTTPVENVGHCLETATVVELHRLAMLVYLHRSTEDLLGQAGKVQEYLDQAFAMLSALSACERQFPIFILGSEARTDHERAIVLDLMARTESRKSSRSLVHAKLLVQAVWAQDDLADVKLEYLKKMTAIISCCSIVPSLV